MAVTQQQIALQMVAQLRVLDPSVSADLGTPERKLIDTVAQSLADAQIDLTALRGALDLDSKFGDALDRFLVLFGFRRRRATYATGFVTLSRLTPTNNDIRVPAGTQVRAIIDPDSVAPSIDGPSDSVYVTTFDVILPGDGQTTSVSAPVRAALPGDHGNIASTDMTFVGATVPLGITSARNEAPITGGQAQETDADFKVRFKNQVFRNLAGTRDQYLALAAATAFTTKANVVGNVSRYREYIQVPPVDDASSYDVNNAGGTEAGGGNAGEWTTALSDVPYSKHVYTEVPHFVSSGYDATALFYRPEVDFRMNTTEATKNRGDTLRESSVSPPLGYAVTDPLAEFQPNVTFLNVYTGINEDVQAIRPGEVVLFEHSYLSAASRNDVENGVTNCVDLFIDGGNDTLASVITTRPDSTAAFVNDPTSRFHYDNYRRIGYPEKRPVVGNILLPLFWEPVTSLPEEIVVNDVTYQRDVHYWAVEDVSGLYGTIRARNGVEWSTTIRGIASGDPDDGGPGVYTGPFINAHASGTPVPVDDYAYDRNIVDLQATVESNRQVTTDVLVHKARQRYFKFDVTLMYEAAVNVATTNLLVSEQIGNYFAATYFGSVVQLSDLLQIIHDVPGIDNVRWTSDVPGGADVSRVYETDRYGSLLTNLVVETTQYGSSTQEAKFQMYFTGEPEGGSVSVGSTANGNVAALAYNVSAATAQTNLRTATGNASLTVTGSGTPADPFRVETNVNGVIGLFVAQNTLTGGPRIIDSDFFLADDELPTLPVDVQAGDTVPGVIIRVRAQNTFTRS